LRVLRSNERGFANHGWLQSNQSFSFAAYYSPTYNQYGCLRVLNEDRVAAQTGFDTHPHANFEIFSYIVRGELTHRDSMHNVEVLRRGDVQFTSAGRGIRHSEHNEHQTDEVHFLQVWLVPSERNTQPSYQTGHFSDSDKLNRLRLIVSPDGADKSVRVRQQVRVFAALLDHDNSVDFELPPNHRGFLHLVQNGGALNVSYRTDSAEETQVLAEGDAVFVDRGGGRLKLQSTAPRSELLLFDLGA